MTYDEIKERLPKIQSKYFAMVAPLYTVAECSLYDAWQLAKSNKTKGNWRMILRNAFNLMQTQGVDVMSKERLCKGYELLLDVGDKIQERTKSEFTYGKVTISNTVINATTRDTSLKTALLYTAWTYEICTSLHDSFFDSLKQELHTDFSVGFAEFRQSKVSALVHRVCEYFCTDCLDAIERAKPEIRKSENAIFNKLFSENFMNLTIREAMIANGGFADAVAQCDREMQEEQDAKLGLDRLAAKYNVRKVGKSDVNNN